MSAFHTMLFAGDFSANSREAFRLASSLAAVNGSRLVAIHVVEPDCKEQTANDPGPGEWSAGTTESYSDFLMRRMGEFYVPECADRCRLQGRRGTTRGGNPADGRNDWCRSDRDGNAWTHRTEAAPGGKCGHRGIERGPLSGSRRRAGTQANTAQSTQVILHPTDFSRESEAALTVARSLARDLGAQLRILHVLPFDIYPEARFADELDPWDSKHTLDEIRQRVDGPDLKYPVETQLVRGFEANEIVDVARDLGAGMIVMGTHGRSGVSRLLMGSTAQSVLTRAECPVLVVRPAPEPSRVNTCWSPHDLIATVF